MRAERGPARHTTFLHARRECAPGRAAQVWHLGIYKEWFAFGLVPDEIWEPEEIWEWGVKNY